MPSTHRRRDATVDLSRVGVGGVYWLGIGLGLLGLAGSY